MTRPPNIIVVLTDDQGRWAMPHRMEELVMPNLADLLDDALELDQFYCASPVCSPARATLLTGRMPSAHGVHDWIVGAQPNADDNASYLDGQPTTPQVLGDAGYQCAMSGKWHLGNAKHPAPGFDSWYAHRYGGGPYFGAPVWRDGEATEEPVYFTHAVTEHALEFLAERDPDRPFYLQVNYTAPHDPWIDSHPQAYLDHYEGCDFPSVPREEPHAWIEPRRDDFAAAFADPVPHLQGYCASLTAVDEGLGQIREALAAQGIADDTVLVFTSDNGFACGHHGVWGKGNGTWPLNMWDNSVRVPFVVRVPGGARGVTETLVSAASLHPTLCDLAGVQPPEDSWAAAGSVAPLLRGEAFESPGMVVVFSEYGGARMITDGRWKLVARFEGPGELYDRAADPDERANLYPDPDYRAQRDELEQALGEWFETRQRGGYAGYGRDVRGFGQLRPVGAGRSDAATYARANAPAADPGVAQATGTAMD